MPFMVKCICFFSCQLVPFVDKKDFFVPWIFVFEPINSSEDPKILKLIQTRQFVNYFPACFAGNSKRFQINLFVLHPAKYFTQFIFDRRGDRHRADKRDNPVKPEYVIYMLFDILRVACFTFFFSQRQIKPGFRLQYDKTFGRD